MFGVQGIEGSNDAVSGFAELEDQQSPAWCQNASEFTNGDGRVGDVADAKRDGDQIDAAVGQFNLHGIALTKLGCGVAGSRPPLRRFFAGMDEHFFRKVHAQRAGWLACREQQRQVAGPTGHVEHAILRCDLSVCHHPPSPGLVLPRRVKAVVEVITMGDGREHLLHASGFVSIGVRIGLQVRICPRWPIVGATHERHGNRQGRRIHAMMIRRSVSAALLLTTGSLLTSGCAYVDYSRHYLSDFIPSVEIARAAGGAGGRVTMSVATQACGADPYVHTSLWMSDLTLAEIEKGDVTKGMILHVELLFPPLAGSTPIDIAATNLSIRCIVISGDEIGIYEGGGFGYPIGTHIDGAMSLRIEPSGMVLGDRTDGFVDLLSPAKITAVYSGDCDTAISERFADSVDQLVTNAIGRTLYVQR